MYVGLFETRSQVDYFWNLFQQRMIDFSEEKEIARDSQVEIHWKLVCRYE